MQELFLFASFVSNDDEYAVKIFTTKKNAAKLAAASAVNKAKQRLKPGSQKTTA